MNETSHYKSYYKSYNKTVIKPNQLIGKTSYTDKKIAKPTLLVVNDLNSEVDIVGLFELQSNRTSINKVDRFFKTFSTISEIDDILDLSKREFPSHKEYLFDILVDVIEDFYSEENNVPISVDSLKGMLIFLYSLKGFTEPSISISDGGMFYIDWEKDLNDSLTIRFKRNFILEYSLFQPSLHTSKLAIRNGRVHVLDFEADIRKLGIKTYQ